MCTFAYFHLTACQKRHPLPTQAAAADMFLEHHLRMEDVRRYLLDVLRLYAALQTFKVGFTAVMTTFIS